MNSLRLNPLPSVRSEAESLALQMEREGFVDEAVVAAMIARPYMKRSVANPEDLALAADDSDFAGWSIPSATPLRETTAPLQPAGLPTPWAKRTPVAEPEEEQDQPHRGSHLWWLAGLACVFSAILFAGVLFFISPPSEAPLIEKGAPPRPAVEQGDTTVMNGTSTDQP